MANDIKILLNLAKSDFNKKFAGSYFGILWMFLQPLATIAVYTLIFQVGFRSTPPIPGVPYVIWLIPGIVPWFYFQEAIILITNVFSEYSFLVKKMVFKVNMLPLIKLLSSLLVHFCFIIIMIIFFILFRQPLYINIIMIFYYSFALSVFILGIGFLTSSINVFFKDMNNIVAICLQFGIWFAPIMYDESIFESRARIVTTIIKFNPIYYIVTGYRNAMLHDGFIIDPILTIYYWTVTIIILIIGYRIFNNLKQHFSDVL